MGKSGAILGLIGIIIGAGGLVLGYIAWSSLDTIQSGNINSWYDREYDTFTVTPAFTVLEVSDLSVSFELSSSASVFLSFTCRAIIYTISGNSQVFFMFKVDGVRLDNPTTNVGNNLGASSTHYYSVNLQHLIENMAAGSHNVTMEVSTQNPANEISEMTLMVQSITT